MSMLRISFGEIEYSKPARENKGKSIVAFPDSYTIIDIETTGFDPTFDDIIEIAAVKISNNTVIDSFESLIKPYDCDIPEYIQELTGITPEMLTSAPSFSQICDSFLSFIGNDILVGHNVNFDINFIYDASDGRLTNSFIDTLRIARRTLPELEHHRLSDLVTHYCIESPNAHRALADCFSTFSCFKCLYSDIIKKFGTIDSFIQKKVKYKLNAKDIHTDNTEFDESNPFFGKNVVFTGTLERMVRKDAMQIIADLGGINQNSVTKKTNYLILGNNDYRAAIKDGKSSKQKKAESLILAGQDIEILSENVFYEMIP